MHSLPSATIAWRRSLVASPREFVAPKRTSHEGHEDLESLAITSKQTSKLKSNDDDTSTLGTWCTYRLPRLLRSMSSVQEAALSTSVLGPISRSHPSRGLSHPDIGHGYDGTAH